MRTVLTTTVVALALLAGAAQATIFSDNFETGVDGNKWEAVPGTNIQILVGDSAHAIGAQSAKQVDADPWIYYMRTKAGAFPNPGTIDPGEVEVAKVMFWDDNNRPASPVLFGGTIMLLNSGVGDLCQLGVSSAVTRTNYYWRTLTNGNNATSVERTQGWHELKIEAYPYTGAAGDVKFYIDNALVGSGQRKVGGGSGVDLNEIRLGFSVRTPGSPFWYDNVDLDMIPEPSGALLILAAGGLGLLRGRRARA